jgi:hypothetical protein
LIAASASTSERAHGHQILAREELRDPLEVAPPRAQVLDPRRLIDGGPGGLAEIEPLELLPRHGDNPLHQALDGEQLPLDLALARSFWWLVV